MDKAVERLHQDPSLVWIKPPQTKQEKFVVAQKVWRMIEDDYNLSISDICCLLDCKKDWVKNHICPNVKHIFLNYFFRKFMHETRMDAPILLKNYYYFSQRDLLFWLDKNTTVIHQTIRLLEINPEYSTPIFSQRAGSDFIVTSLLPSKFISMNTVQKKYGFTSPELVYRKIFEYGYPKFLIDDSLVRYDFDLDFSESIIKDTQLYWARDVL